MNGTGYKQLTQEQRYQIYALRQAGHGPTRIAQIVGTHKSTISRELTRNRGQRGYRPQQAHRTARERQQNRARRPRITTGTWQQVEERLRQEWSPEQIAGWLKLQLEPSESVEPTGPSESVPPRPDPQAGSRVSHESIYQHVYADKRAGGTLHSHLRCQKKRRKRGRPLGSAVDGRDAARFPSAAASVSVLPWWKSACV